MRRPLLALPLAILVTALAPAAASAQADIEAIWSFSGGQVAVQAAAGRELHRDRDPRDDARRLRPSRWASRCGSASAPQPDGQYFGGHQWYTNADCAPIATRGNTAYRVLLKPDGSRFLRVCFAAPETPEIQPTIAPDGTATPENCNDSDLVSPLPNPAGKPELDTIVTLPKQGKKKCMSRRSFKIRLREPRGDALKSAEVFLNGKRIQVRTGKRLTAPINLKGLPKGRYTVKIVAKTVLGKTIQGKRKYRTCAKKRRGGSHSPV